MDRVERTKVLDDGDRKTDQDSRFDASQYAFFGRGDAQDVVLGGLDDDENEDIDHLNEFDEDDELSASAGRDEAGGSSGEIGDVGELSTSFFKLNAGDGAQLDTSFLGRDVHDLPADISWTDTSIEHERTHWAQQKPTLQRQQDPGPHQPQQQQEWWSNVPKPHGLSSSNRQQFLSGPQVVHPMMHYGNVPGLPPQTSSWLQGGGGPTRPESPLMPPQVLQFQRSQGFHGPFPMQHVNVMQQQHKLEAEYRAKQHGSTPPRVVPPDGSYVTRKNPEGAPQMRSKYMTTEEIETIVRIQWAATHGSDPYTDDYYHQAMQAKLAGGTPHGRRHFAPSHLRELPSHARTAAEPHAFLQVDALGRIPYSSIRRPRPLLDVDGVNDKSQQVESLSSQRRLEQEPMLAARIAVEDGLCLLLDVDDIDRMLSVSQHPDGGVQLRRRRHMLLEGLAASLQLVDPLSHHHHHLQQQQLQQQQQQQQGDSNGRVGAGGRDDLVFLRLVSLPKGRKLLSRYLRLLSPGTELARVVLMAVFRHLRFLFGGLHSDPASSLGLITAAVSTIKLMDLASVSACLAAVVLAAEPPPLRPIGSPSGDGATVVLQAVLERATAILSDPGFVQQQFAVVHHHSTELWQASFDAFFGLLAKYCDNKYESIMHSLMMASSSSSPGGSSITSAAAVAMAREMPMELLRASLPHTNEQQRKRLLEFAQRSIVSGIHSSGNVGDSPVNAAAAVRG